MAQNVTPKLHCPVSSERFAAEVAVVSGGYFAADVVPVDALPLRSFSGCFAAISSTAPITTGYQGIEMYFVLGSVAGVVK
jgi:hypothetical protein